jgi:hypothetical protein
VNLGLAVLVLCALAGPAAAHHIGTWTPRDNEVSTNFKQIKFSMQGQKFDVAQKLYVAGPLRRELAARAATLPAGLDESIEGALGRGDGTEAERGLMVFFLGLVRDLAQEADRQVGDQRTPASARAVTGRRFLEAIWRYYNLIDFAVSQRAPKAAAGVRLAFEEAEESVKEGAPAAGVNRMRPPLRRIAELVTGVIEASATTARRES